MPNDPRKWKYLRAAEFARLAGVNKKTLHYYDEIGLFKPAFVNEKGYRFYTLPQLDRLALIAVLKELGVPLKEIKTYLECGDAGRLDRMLAQQEEEIDRRIRQLDHSRQLLRGLREQSRTFLARVGQGCQVWTWPAVSVTVLLEQAELKRGQEDGLVVNYLTDGLYTGACYVGREVQFLYQKDPAGERIIPGGRYLCLYGGEPEDTQQAARARYADALRTYAARHGLELAGEFYIDFADILAAQPGMQYFCIRAQVLGQNEEILDEVSKAEDEIL